MNILSAATGGAYTAVAVLISFFVILFIRLAYLGSFSVQKKPEKKNPPEEQKKKPDAPAEPVYYIVERKKKRSKSDYSEPKEIQFK